MKHTHLINPLRTTFNHLALALAVAAGLGLTNTQAAINVTATGSGVQAFSTTPAITEWSTLSWTGTAGNITDSAGMDAAVQLLTAAGINAALTSSGSSPPSANVLVRHNNPLLLLTSRPTTAGAINGCLLLAKLQNTSGGGIDNLEISYDFGKPATGVEELAGLRCYYSLTGLAGSWTAIPEFCTDIPGPLSAVVALTSTWADATPMYVLWADDNSAAAGDTYTIDNVSFGMAGTGADIKSFGLPGYPGIFNVNGTDIAIGNIPIETSLTTLAPSFTLSYGATCDRVSGGPTTYDFTSPVAYTVTPAVGTAKVYIVEIVHGPPILNISTISTPGPQGITQGILINATVGTGNIGRLVGETMTYWGSGGFSVPVILNENTLIIDSGGGNTMNAIGPISGNGIVRLQDGGANPIRIQGSTGNTYTGTTVIAATGNISLEKTSGDALNGAITVNGASSLVWVASNQINDASDVTLVNSGGFLNLNGNTDTINELYLVTGTQVQTGAGGILKVARLFINGIQQDEVAYIAGDGYVTGSGYIEVGASGPPIIETVPAVPATPAPADLATTVHPAFLPKLDWADCSGATNYDVYLVLATDPDPVPGTTPVTANVLLSEYTVSPQVLSLTDYKWMVVAKNGVGPTVGPLWTFTTVDRRDISNATTPAESGNPSGGVHIDQVVGAGEIARLVGTTQTFWTEGFTNSINLNGNTFYIDSGGNENRVANGAIFGTGVVVYRSTGPPPGRVVGGGTGNTYTGPTTVSGIVTLNKTAGEALCSGPITLDENWSLLVWAASDQIHDASDLTLTTASAMLNLAGFSDTIASLNLAAGTSVETGSSTGGVLTVGSLTVNGTVMDPGTYTASNSTFVFGLGSVVVSGGTGSPFDTWAATYAGGGTPGEDYNNDGVSNGVAYFMGMNGLATNPSVETAGSVRTVTWSHVGVVTSFEVQVSDNLSDWSPADPGDVVATDPPTGQVVYTFPGTLAKQFCRLVVTP